MIGIVTWKCVVEVALFHETELLFCVSISTLRMRKRRMRRRRRRRRRR